MRRFLHRVVSLSVVVFACLGLWRAVDWQVAQAGQRLSEREQGRPEVESAAGGTPKSHLARMSQSTYPMAPGTTPASRSESLYQPKWPTAAAMRWQPPRGFLREAFCIHRHESVDWYRAYVDWRGYPSRYSGGLQFTLSTWQRAGGLGHAWEWRPREQVYRAYRIWRLYRTASRPGSWSEWGSRGKCGLS